MSGCTMLNSGDAWGSSCTRTNTPRSFRAWGAACGAREARDAYVDDAFQQGLYRVD